MTAAACTLAALLLSAATAPATTDECELADHRCKATLFERRAANAHNPEHRAVYLYNAHRLYMRLFDESGDTRDLCAARRTIDASLAVTGQSPSLRSKSETLRAEVLTRARQQDTRCGPGHKRRPAKPSDAPQLARGPAAPPPAPSTEARPTSAPDSPPTTTTRPLPLLLDADAPPPSTELALMPVAPRPVDTPPAPRPRAPTPRRGQGLVIAGGATFAVGAALAIGAGFASRRMSATRQEILDLGERAEDTTTTLQAAKDAALRQEYETHEDLRLGLAVGSGATIVAAIILASVGGRRMARTASQTAFLPAPGGLVFRLRF